MALQDALKFFEQVARSALLRERLRQLHAEGAASDLRRLAAEFGCRFSEKELQQAFRIDWQMRRRRFGAETATPPRSSAARRRKPR